MTQGIRNQAERGQLIWLNLMLLVGLFLTFHLPGTLKAQAEPKNPDLDAVSAFQGYAKNLEIYEKRRRNELQSEFNKKKSLLEATTKTETDESRAKQKEFLGAALKKYREQLSKNPAPSSMPALLLNLASAAGNLGDLWQKDDTTVAAKHYQEALSYLDILERDGKSTPAFGHAMYLKATLLEALGQEEAALQAWATLTQVGSGSEFVIYAHIALGDYRFQKAQFQESTQSFQAAEKILIAAPSGSRKDLLTKVQYRLAWSAFRSGQHQETIRSCLALLQTQGTGINWTELDALRKDAIDLAADALFSLNSLREMTGFFRQENLSQFGAAIGLKVLSRLKASGLHQDVTRVGEVILEKYALAKESPRILSIVADSYKQTGKIFKAQDLLENLAMMLPMKSLWRSQFASYVEETREMEALAESAALALAASFYSNGLMSGNPKAFVRAETIYQTLIDFKPTDPRTAEWALKIGHCQFFAKNYTEAIKHYQDTVKTKELNPDQLQLALYQTVIAMEQSWRDSFAKVVSSREIPSKSPKTLSLVNQLGESVNRYYERFPNQPRSVDLLLVAASAYRDMDLLDKAAGFWQRVLIQDASQAQRSLAIRGILYSKIKLSGSKEVIHATVKFLKLEKWESLSSSLYLELNGILSSALLDEADRLRNQGLISDAGRLLSEHGELFKDLPDRDRILRDGAYFYGIAGQWRQAEIGANKYQLLGGKKFAGDMQYLLARAREYQLKIKDSAYAYFTLAKEFPTHLKSTLALDRAESLAAAEGLRELSIEISLLRANKTSRPQDKIRYLDEAIRQNLARSDFSQAEKLARNRLRLSETPTEKLRSRAKLAQITYLSGDEQEGLDELKIIDQQINTSRGKIPRQDYADLAGQINLLRGNHFKNLFDDYRLEGDTDTTQARINGKSSLFSALSQHYDTVIARGTPLQAAEARFYIGNAAETFSNEVAGIPIKGEPSSFKATSRNRSTVQRLQDLAQKYHSDNVLLSRQNPQLYAQSEWVKKSASRINFERSKGVEQKFQDMTPIASQEGIISQWNIK